MSQDSQEENSVSPEVSISINPDFTIIGSTAPIRLNRFPRKASNACKMLTEDYNIDDTDLPSRRASSPEKRTLRNSVIKLLEQQEFARRFSAPEKTRSRRSSSIVKTVSEEHEEVEPTSRRSSRSGSIVKMTSEDNFADDELSRRSSRADFTDFEKRKSIRRGSSVVRMLSEEHIESDKSTSTRSEPIERPENADKFRKSIDNGYKHSLESISEYKANTFSANTFYPSLESPTLNCLSDFAQNLAENLKDTDRTTASSNYLSWLETVNNEYYGTPRGESDNKSGEWNCFWTNYNSSTNQYFSSPFLCPSNSIDELSTDSNCTPQLDKGCSEKVVFTLDEVNEALHCAQRVTDILKDALKRAEESDGQNSYSKEEKVPNNEANKKTEEKPSASNSCIETFLNHTGVADILKKVLNKRREVIMPADESSRRSSGSGWTSFDTTKK